MSERRRRLAPASSLQARLLLATSALAVVAVVAVAVAARQGTRLEFVKFREDLRSLAGVNEVTDPASLVSLLDGTCCSPDALARVEQRLGPRDVLVVLDAQGRQVALTAGAVARGVRDIQVTASGDTLTLTALQQEGNTLENLVLQYKRPATGVTLADGRAARLFVLPLPAAQRAPADAFLQSVDRRLVLATALIGMAAVVVTWLLTRHALRPVRELQQAAAAIARGDFSARVATAGHDELSELARSFNTMAAELQRQKDLREHLVHDVVHELRTPLTGLRCRIESIADGMSRDPKQALHGAGEDVMHLTRLVGDLHEIALAEARALRLDIGDVDVQPLILSAIRGAALEGDPRVRVEAGVDLLIRADAVRSRQVLMNLLTNAARHTPADGAIVLGATRAADEIRIHVRNTGSTLTDDQVAHVFDRFYRADPSRQRSTGGTGLGLAIVKTLVEAQGGRVWASATDDSVTFVIALPLG